MTRKLALLVLCPLLALAQTRSISARAGTVRSVQGNATIDGNPVRMRPFPATPVQMSNGQRLHVEWGRVELRLGPGAALIMPKGATLCLEESRLSDVQLEFEEGSGLIKVEQVYKGGRLRVMMPGGAVELRAPGWYRFDADPQTLRVYRGDAQLVRGDSVIKARKGQAVDTAGRLSAFNLKASDPLIDRELQQAQADENRQRRQAEIAALQRARGALFSDERQEMSRDRNPSPLPPTPSQRPGIQ
jgi:hypothetical protein